MAPTIFAADSANVLVVTYFAVFLCGFAPLRDVSAAREELSRKDAKSQRRAKSN